MKVTVTEEYYGEDWGDGRQLSGEAITFKGEDGKSIGFSVREGEPEDMIFGRNLEGVHSIMQLMELAHQAGVNGERLVFKTIEERD